MLGLPYFGRDIAELEQECVDGIRQHSKSEPCEDLSAFNPRVKSFGEIWAEVIDRDEYVYVIAGVSGNMSGVPVASFFHSNRDAALRYAKDFEAGKVFAIQNNERWCDYVNAAHSVKSINSNDRQFLISRGRKSGVSLDGIMFNQASLKDLYISGSI